MAMALIIKNSNDIACQVLLFLSTRCSLGAANVMEYGYHDK